MKRSFTKNGGGISAFKRTYFGAHQQQNRRISIRMMSNGLYQQQATRSTRNYPAFDSQMSLGQSQEYELAKYSRDEVGGQKGKRHGSQKRNIHY
jgi:hypothetical protein